MDLVILINLNDHEYFQEIVDCNHGNLHFHKNYDPSEILYVYEYYFKIGHFFGQN